MIIRDEQAGDAARIRELVREAFAQAEHSSGTEWKIVDALREARSLSVSLVATDGDDLIGHVAMSPVTIGEVQGWHGLGPVAVLPGRQRVGAGSALIREALDRLQRSGAAGCVVVGEPTFYSRFGFSPDPSLTYADVPPPYLQARTFRGPRPSGEVTYHPAFAVAP